MAMKFTKYSALGNDYIVIDPNINLLNLEKHLILLRLFTIISSVFCLIKIWVG